MFWMVMYFTFGAWSSILLVAAPTTKPHASRTLGEKMLPSAAEKMLLSVA